MWTGNYFEIDLCFIRHGKTALNREKRYISYTDEALCDEGKAEIRNKVEAKLYPKVDTLFSSGMVRCNETAELIYPGMETIAVSQLQEINFGSFEGKNYVELSDDPDYKAWLDSNCAGPIPGGESRVDFINRQLNGLDIILTKAKEYKTASVVCHGGTIMAIFSSFTDKDYFDYMIDSGDCIGCHIEYILEDENVHVSRFSVNNWMHNGQDNR